MTHVQNKAKWTLIKSFIKCIRHSSNDHPNSPQCKPELGGFLQVVWVLWWVSSRLYRFMTSGKFRCSGTRCPGNQTGKEYCCTCPLGSTWPKAWKGKEPGKNCRFFHWNSQFFGGGLKRPEPAGFFWTPVLWKYPEVAGSLIAIFFPKYPGLTVL